MTNLFAYRATLPEVMKATSDPVGPDNDEYLRALAADAGVVVAAWGANGTHKGRDAEVRELRGQGYLDGEVGGLGELGLAHARVVFVAAQFLQQRPPGPIQQTRCGHRSAVDPSSPRR